MVLLEIVVESSFQDWSISIIKASFNYIVWQRFFNLVLVISQLQTQGKSQHDQ